MKPLYLALILLFLFLAAIHFYWALGGIWGFENALPHNTAGERILKPKPVECAVVGLGLLAFGAFYYIKTGMRSPIHPPKWVLLAGSWLIPIVFLLRSIGDFKYVGFFKTISSTTFARLDSFYYSPLCLIIAVVGIILLFNR